MKAHRGSIILAFILLPALAPAEQAIDQTFTVPAEGKVVIDNPDGFIKVTAWDREEVHVVGRLDERATRLDVESGEETEEKVTRIQVVYPPKIFRLFRTGRGTDLEISVPVQSRIDVNGVSGNIDVRGIAGGVMINTVSGSITVDNSAREYELASVSGSVHLKGTQGGARVKANSVSGSLHLEDIYGALDASTVSGRVSISGGELSSVNASSTSGSIGVESSFTEGGLYSFSAVSGNVSVLFDGSPIGIFDVSTRSGAISSNIEPGSSQDGQVFSGQELTFNEGDSSSKFIVRTTSGSISLQSN